MEQNRPLFSASQLEFLAAMAALDEPASMDTLGTLVPLPPGPLFDLIRRTEARHWIEQDPTGNFRLTSELPDTIRSELQRINTPMQLAQRVSRLQSAGLFRKLSKHCRSVLLTRTGRQVEAFALHMEVALEMSVHSRAADFFSYLKQMTDRLPALECKRLAEPWFVANALELSQVCISLGAGVADAVKLLESGLAAAKSLGDQRSEALINLHLGHLYYLSSERGRAMEALTAGKKKTEEIGDSDILEQAAEFIGLYYAIQGLIREAAGCLEKALKPDEAAQMGCIKPLAPLLLANCEVYLGQFHRAVGCLDCHWHIARRSNKPAVAATLRAALGTVLLLIKKKKEALHHLNAAKCESENGGFPFACYLAVGGLAYYHFLEGDLQKAYDLFMTNLDNATQAGTIGQFSSPWVLEIIAEFDQRGFPERPGWGFKDYYQRSLKDPNIHLQGVARRLHARALLRSGAGKRLILEELLESEKNLKRAGDPIQLAKTRLELAQLKLREERPEEARLLVEQARQGLAGHWEDFFPDGLRALLDERPTAAQGGASNRNTVGFNLVHCLEFIEEVIPKPNLDDNLDQLVSALNRFFMAERGALFWFDHQGADTPVLRAGCNMLQGSLDINGFRPILQLITRCFREKKPMVFRSSNGENKHTFSQLSSVLCIPVEVGGRFRGVLYFDNSYIDDCFHFENNRILSELARYLSTKIEKIWRYNQLIEEAAQDKFGGLAGKTYDDELLFQSAAMMRIINQAHRVAQTTASVLLIGETGVGKEAVARWIHRSSLRRDAPFVVIDPTTIPENLVESELFGHEKGAFTGAHRRKNGRLELAHSGTLFIDEIGEIPLGLQAKLLRVLQEKTFTRVGGTQLIRSDFRLLTATNRNLSTEVRKGNFREDLYYRINVLELAIAPLRERPEDILLLARHFIEKYARRHNRPIPALLKEEQRKLSGYHWPGNVRELQNVIERSILLSVGKALQLNLPLPSHLAQSNPFSDMPTMEEIQRRYIAYVLEKTQGRIGGSGGAAELLGMKRTTMHSRMDRLGFFKKSVSGTCE